MTDKVKYKYFAFISYKSDDVKWASWLQKRLERYSLPVALQQKYNLPRKLRPIFRDGTDILPKALKEELGSHLEQSKYLIVICSPRSASSDWVGSEIDEFCKLGRRDRVIALIVDGVPYSEDPSTECYHPKLKEWFPKGLTVDKDRQLLGADIHMAGPGSSFYKKERAFIQVVATMLQLPFDALWNRRLRHIIVQSIVASLVFIFTLIIIGYVWYMGRPFDVEVTLNERSPHNDVLPFKNGTLTLVSGTDTLGVRPVVNIDHTISFANIPGKFRNSGVRMIYDMYGYHCTDTLLHLTTSHSIDIRRDDTYAIFAGTIIEENGVTPVPGAIVQIDSQQTTTDSLGHFEIRFPITEQQLLKHVIISKEGYSQKQYDLQPQHDHYLMLSY